MWDLSGDEKIFTKVVFITKALAKDFDKSILLLMRYECHF